MYVNYYETNACWNFNLCFKTILIIGDLGALRAPLSIVPLGRYPLYIVPRGNCIKILVENNTNQLIIIKNKNSKEIIFKILNVQKN